MRSCYRVILCLLLIASPALTQQPARPKSIARDVAQRTLPSIVVLVMSNSSADGMSLGSGFFVAPDIVVTNYHVVEGALSGVARINGQQGKYEVAGFVALDRERDLALVKLKGATGKPLVIGDSSVVAIGDEIFAVGNPMGLEGTFSQGIVSSIRQLDGGSLIQITAPISPGSSGGAVVDQQGKVIGVAVGSIVDGQSLNFAIPSTYLRTLLANRKPLLSFADAFKDSSAETASAQSVPGTHTASSGVPGGVAGLSANGHSAPSLDTEDAYERRMPSLHPDLRVVTRITLNIERKGKPKETIVLTPENGRITTNTAKAGAGHIPDYVGVEYNGRNTRWKFEFTTNGAGRNLSPGSYLNCADLYSWGAPGISINGNSYYGSTTDGAFTVYDVDFKEEQGRYVPGLNSLTLSFKLWSKDTEVRGVININSVPIDGLQ